MTKFEATKSWLAEATGLIEPATLERLQRVDWREYAPTSKQVDALYRPYTQPGRRGEPSRRRAGGRGPRHRARLRAERQRRAGDGSSARARARPRRGEESLEATLPEGLRITRMDEVLSQR